MQVSADDGGNPVTTAVTVSFGAPAVAGSVARYFHNSVGAWFTAGNNSFRIGSLSIAVSNVVYEINPTLTVNFAVRSYLRPPAPGAVEGSVTAAASPGSFAYEVRAEYAAYQHYLGDLNIRNALHFFYGEHTSAEAIDRLKTQRLDATYTIPRGRRPRHLLRGAQNATAAPRDYFLNNLAQAGALGVDFAAAEATLNLTLAAMNTSGGSVADNFLAISGFEMQVAGNSFNNHRCATAAPATALPAPAPSPTPPPTPAPASM